MLFPVPAERKKPALAGTAAGDGPTVLVIDDEDFVVMLAQTVLQRAGFRVLSAMNADEGIETFRKNADTVKAVLLDVMLGDADGSDVHRALRSIRPDIPIILSTGYTSADVDPAVSGTAATEFLQKPYQPETLISTINTLIQA
jgi:CheY-like chemotaxis protein